MEHDGWQIFLTVFFWGCVIFVGIPTIVVLHRVFGSDLPTREKLPPGVRKIQVDGLDVYELTNPRPGAEFKRFFTLEAAQEHLTHGG